MFFQVMTEICDGSSQIGKSQEWLVFCRRDTFCDLTAKPKTKGWAECRLLWVRSVARLGEFFASRFIGALGDLEQLLEIGLRRFAIS
jgi:hypothetical protein